MAKQILQHLELSIFAEIGLLLFVTIFVGSAAWILLKPRRDVVRWAGLALDDPTDTMTSPSEGASR